MLNQRIPRVERSSLFSLAVDGLAPDTGLPIKNIHGNGVLFSLFINNQIFY